MENAIKSNNTLEARVAPIWIAYTIVAAVVALVIEKVVIENENETPQVIEFQPAVYSQMVKAQSSDTVVFVTASNDPNPVTVALTTTSNKGVSILPTQ